MSIALRNTFLEVVGKSAAPPTRATSAPPAQGGRSASSDSFGAERAYAEALAGRAALLLERTAQKGGVKCPATFASLRSASTASQGTSQSKFDTNSSSTSWGDASEDMGGPKDDVW